MVDTCHQRNRLPSNLPQLQNLIKRDPAAYRDEVCVLGKERVGKSVFLSVYAAVPALPESKGATD